MPGLSTALGARLRSFRPQDRWACLAAYGLILVWCAPLLWSLDGRGPPTLDWEWFLAYYQALRTTLLDHQQLPFLNPWMYLGSPLWANPQIGPVSHFTPLVLLAGPVYGMKLGILVGYLLSFEGGRALGRKLFREPLAAVAAGLLYALNAAISSHWVLGQVCFSSYALAPFLFLFCLRLAERPFAGAAAGAVAGLMIHYGVHYFTVQALLLAALLCVWIAVRERAGLRLLRFGALFGLAALAVAAPRLLPLLEVMRDFPRQLRVDYAVDGETLLRTFLIPELGPARTVLRMPRPGVTFQLTSSEFYGYAGALTLLLALASLRWGARFYHLGALLCFLLLLGTYRPWHLSSWLGKLPPFDALWVVTRWRVPLLACLALAAARSLDELLARARAREGPAGRRRLWATRALVWAAPLELILLLFPSWARHVCPYRDRPMSRAELGLPETSHALAVHSVLSARQGVARKDWPRLYFAPQRANVGAVAGYEPLFGYLPQRSDRLWSGHPRYRGEHTVDGHAVTPREWSPNRIRFAGLTPGAMLEVNLNPGRGWSASGAPLFEDHALFELRRRFAVRVPASGELELRYLPPGLGGGVALSVGCALLLGALLLAERRRARAAHTPQ